MSRKGAAFAQQAREWDQVLLEKGLPVSFDAERMVLGCMLESAERAIEIGSKVSIDEFFLTKHKTLYRTILDVAGMNIGLDRVTVGELLLNRGQLEEVDGMSYLADLDDGLPKVPNINGYVEILHEKSNLRRLAHFSEKLMHAVLDGSAVSREIVSDLSTRLYEDFQSRAGGGGPVTTEKYIETYPGGVEAFLSPHIHRPAIPTGFKDIDELVAGFRAGQTWLIVARPSHGKTTWTLNVVRNLAKRGHRVVVFSLESGTDDLIYSMVSNETQIGHRRFLNGELDRDERECWAQGMERVMSWPILWDHCPGITAPALGVKLKQIHQQTPVSLYCVDYIQLMGVENSRKRNENQIHTEIATELTRLSSSTRIPGLLMSQSNREPEREKKDKRPHISQARGSGSWEQGPRVAAVLYNEEKHSPEKEECKGKIEFIIEKNSGGKTGKVILRFQGWSYSFTDYSE